MVEEYGGVVQFARLIVESGVNAFLAAEKALEELPWTRSWGKTTVTLEPVGVAGLITAWNANALFICLKLASAVAAGCTVVIKPSELSSLQTQVMLECSARGQAAQGRLQRRDRPRRRRRRRARAQSGRRQDLLHGLGGRGRADHARWRGDDEARDARTGRQVAHDPAR